MFATAGTEEKRDYLRQLGIANVFDSRTLEFADQVPPVDVVLNSLSGEFLVVFGTVRPGGRFIELGKRDTGVRVPEGVEHHIFDLGDACEAQPAQLRAMLIEALDSVAAGTVRPAPIRAFPLADAERAFRTMAHAKHIGKIVLTQHEAAERFASNATYLITGGLGDSGLTVAEWMIECGARHLVLVSRHTRALPETLPGADVHVMGADVSDPEQVARVPARDRTDAATTARNFPCSRRARRWHPAADVGPVPAGVRAKGGGRLESAHANATTAARLLRPFLGSRAAGTAGTGESCRGKLVPR